MTQDFDWGIFWFCILLIGITRNVAESSLDSFAGFIPAILLFMLTLSSSQNARQQDHGVKNSFNTEGYHHDQITEMELTAPSGDIIKGRGIAVKSNGHEEKEKKGC